MIFQKIYELNNLQNAWAKVRSAKSPPGVDHITCDQFEKNLAYNLQILQRQIREETYRPLPVIMYNKAKNKGSRSIGISTIRDKIVQYAILKVISIHFENHFLPCCYAYRPGLSALSAIKKASQLIKKGNLWCLQMDVTNFFNSMNHDCLLNLIVKRIDEKPLIRLLSRLLTAKIFKEMGLFDTTIGSQQGSGLSPLLSNIYMEPVDQFLFNKYGDAYLRYSDDISIFHTEQTALEQAKTVIERCLTKIALTINTNKVSITHLSNGVIYLGYYIDIKGMGPSKKAVNQIQKRLEKFNAIRKSDHIHENINQITAIIRGWHSYYKTLAPLQPQNILSLISIVQLAKEFGETNLAKNLLKKSSDFTYQHPDICTILGNLFLSMGMESHAIREFSKTLKSDPDNDLAKEKIQMLQDNTSDIHKALENIRLLLHHHPTYRDAYEKLIEHYTSLGLYGFAEKAHEKVLEMDADNSPTLCFDKHSLDQSSFEYQRIDIHAVLNLFKGNTKAHAKQWVDEQGKWGFIRVDRPLKKQDILKHLSGELTLGIYLVTSDDKVHSIVFDVDTAKRKILELSPQELEKYRLIAHQDILRIQSACQQMGLHLYIEDSGYKGRHGWLFFEQPYPASQAQKLGQRIMQLANGPSQDMIWELFPMGKSDRHKSIIKLPLGINRKNNKRCLFLTENGLPAKDQSLFLHNIQFNKISKITHMTGQKDPNPMPYQFDSVPSGLKKMITHCRILNHIISKAKDTNYLTHYERLCLLYSITFAGEQGKQFLHAVMGYCINYNQDYTERQIQRRKENPISCAKIADYFPDLVESLSCQCKFKLPSRGYPSPVMYLLESEIEQAYNYKQPYAEEEDKMNPPKKQKQPQPMHDNDSILIDFEKIFSEEMQITENENNTHFEKQPSQQINDSIDKEPIKSHFEKQPSQQINDSIDKQLTSDFDSDLIETPGQNGLDTWTIFSQYLGLLHDRNVLTEKIRQVEKQLDQMFRTLDSQMLKTPSGSIQRIINSDGSIHWNIQTT